MKDHLVMFLEQGSYPVKHGSFLGSKWINLRATSSDLCVTRGDPWMMRMMVIHDDHLGYLRYLR